MLRTTFKRFPHYGKHEERHNRYILQIDFLAPYIERTAVWQNLSQRLNI